MDYLPLVFAELLGGGYLVCSVAQVLLWLFECHSSTERGPTKQQTAG